MAQYKGENGRLMETKHATILGGIYMLIGCKGFYDIGCMNRTQIYLQYDYGRGIGLKKLHKVDLVSYKPVQAGVYNIYKE